MTKKEHQAAMAAIAAERDKFIKAFAWTSGECPAHVKQTTVRFTYTEGTSTYHYSALIFNSADPIVIVHQLGDKHKVVYTETEIHTANLSPGGFFAYLENAVRTALYRLHEAA